MNVIALEDYIGFLNSHLESEYEKDPRRGAAEIIDIVAGKFELNLLDEDDTCRLYEIADGQRINCWVEGAMSELPEMGGWGFDDQVELWDKE